MELKVEIQFEDDVVVDALFDKVNVKAGDEFSLTSDCKIVVTRYVGFRTGELPLKILEFAFTWGVGVASGVLSNWLYDKLKQAEKRSEGKTRVVIKNKIVKIEEIHEIMTESTL